jgi:flagellar biosynthesis/type III secretory pathway M-ring protein FliF/YscJ
MSVLVEQQDEQITQIETTAMAVETDMEVGVQYQDKAIVSATNARKGRKICFAITAVVAIIIIIIIVVKVILPLMNKGNDKSAPASSSAATSAAASTAKAAVAATATAARRAIAGRILLPAPTPVPVF